MSRCHPRFRLSTAADASRAGEPVMILDRRTYTAHDELVEVAPGVHAASRFAWTYSFTIPD